MNRLQLNKNKKYIFIQTPKPTLELSFKDKKEAKEFLENLDNYSEDTVFSYKNNEDFYKLLRASDE